jgi:dihydrofolate reductase
MREVILAMMTTLDGRLDDPGEEMFAYWPGALVADEGFAGSNVSTNQRMARKMNDYKKVVISRDGDAGPLAWHNTERVVVDGDQDLRQFVETLKAQPGQNIHLAGGATLAQEFVRLGLIDEYRFFVYPTVSPGLRWFDRVDVMPPLDLVTTDAYANGVVGLHYRPRIA